MGGSITLRNPHGLEVVVLLRGAIIQSLRVPDTDGNVEDVVLGFDEEAPYKDGTSPYMGALVGRVANRIAGAQFSLDGETYRLAANNGPNCLHGGKVGYDKVEWDMEPADSDEGQGVRLSYRSKDGEEGFPGTVQVSVTYTLTPGNELITEMRATTDKATPLNLAQHSYFNLAGHGSGDVLDHQLTIHGDHYTPVDDVSIPTGDIAPVRGTPFDFTSPHTVGERIEDVPGPAPGGYDHNYVLFGLGPDARDKCHGGMASDAPQLAATLVDPESGRGMHVLTTTPGVQFYSGNSLGGGGKCGGGVRAEMAACGARAAPPTTSTRGCAWRRRASPTPSTSPTSPQWYCALGRSTATYWYTSSSTARSEGPDGGALPAGTSSS